MARRSLKKSRKLRVAFIGAGAIAGTHMGHYAKMDDVEMLATADINPQATEAWSKQFGIPQRFSDYRKMLAKVKPDAVSVCTPNGLHAAATIAALSAGAHVLVEKPLAMNAREGRRMLDAARKHRRKLVIGFQYRFDAKTQFLKQAIDAGRFGRILYARVQALRRRGIPNWGVFGRRALSGGGRGTRALARPRLRGPEGDDRYRRGLRMRTLQYAAPDGRFDAQRNGRRRRGPH